VNVRIFGEDKRSPFNVIIVYKLTRFSMNCAWPTEFTEPNFCRTVLPCQWRSAHEMEYFVYSVYVSS